jgi:hypothetical protein
MVFCLAPNNPKVHREYLKDGGNICPGCELFLLM